MPADDPGTAEKVYPAAHGKGMPLQGGYYLIQAAKPQTLGCSLNDSPACLCNWFTEKLRTRTDNNGNIEDAFSRDVHLANISIYWFTQTLNLVNRIYYEATQALLQTMFNPLQKLNSFDKTGDKAPVPTGIALAPKKILLPPKEYAERFLSEAVDKAEKGRPLCRHGRTAGVSRRYTEVCSAIVGRRIAHGWCTVIPIRPWQ